MKARLLASVVLIHVVADSSANAADLQQPFIVPEAKPASSEGWTFAASPYFWVAGISGDVGQFGLPAVHLESEFGDILKDPDFGFMAVGEARHDRFSVFGDVIYTKVSPGAATPLGIEAGRFDATSQTFAGLVGAGQADLGWDLAAGVGYAFDDRISAVAGYRALGVGYSNDGFVFNVVQQGQILGLIIRFFTFAASRRIYKFNFGGLRCFLPD